MAMEKKFWGINSIEWRSKNDRSTVTKFKESIS